MIVPSSTIAIFNSQLRHLSSLGSHLAILSTSLSYWQISSIMWSATLRPSPVRWFRTPNRALSSSFTRGRARPRGPRNSIQRPERIPSARGEGAQPQPQPSQPPQPESSHPNTANYDPSRNTLLAPVHIPEDPNAVLRENHPAVGLLANSGLVVQRQLELMNVMM